MTESTSNHRIALRIIPQPIEAGRPQHTRPMLWTTFQRIEESVIGGSHPGRGAQGRRLPTRPVVSIDRGVSLNRALWMLVEEMRKRMG